MKAITLKNVSIQFDADQATKGTPEEQAQQAVDLINGALQREPYGLGAQVIVGKIKKSDVKTKKI